jgi:hypothetical protein
VLSLAEKNKNNNKRNSPIEKLVKSIIQQRGSLYRDTYGTGDTVIKELDKDMNMITNILNDFIQDKEKDNGNIVNQLSSYSNKKYMENSQEFNKLNEILGDKENLDIVTAMYLDLKPRIELYKDFENIYELIPQLKDAVCTIRDNILSPDDFSKIVLNISYDNTNNSMESLIKKIRENYKLDVKAKKIIEKTLIYGEQYVSVISYKDAFENILKNKNKDKNSVLPFKKISESTWGLIGKDFKEREQTEIWKKTCENIQIGQGIENINGENLETMYVFQESQQSTTGTATINKDKIKSTKNIAQDGTISHSEKNINLNLPGSYVKLLDVKKIIPIIINDTCLGYYYIEVGEDLLNTNDFISLGNVNRITLKNVFNNNTVVRDQMYEKLSNLIYNSLDQKFIENNRNLKKFIYEMVQYHDAINKRIKITYLKPEEVVHFKINEDENGRGKGVFYDILFVAKIYLAIMITNTMMRLTRKPDKRVYYVKQGVNPEVGRSIQNALIQLKKDQGSIYDINHISRIMSFAGRFTDLFIPVSDQGEKPIDFDVMGGQDIEVKDEFVEMIERIMVNGTGLPNIYNNFSSEIDYARTLSMANGKFIRLIVSYQLDFEDPLTIWIKKIMKSEITDEENSHTYSIDSIKVSLPSPVTLNLTNSIDLFNNVNTIVDDIIQTEFGDEQPDAKIIKNVRRKLVRNFIPNLDWGYIDKVVEQSYIDAENEKNNPRTNGEQQA